MKVKLLLTSLLLGGVVGVYGSGTEMPGDNQADAEQNDGSVPSLGKEVNAAVSTEVVCSNEHLYAASPPAS